MYLNYRTREAVDSINKYFRNFYFQTFCRMPPYVIGILLGWLLYRTKDKAMNIQLNKVCLMLILTLIKSTWIMSKYFRNLHLFFAVFCGHRLDPVRSVCIYLHFWIGIRLRSRFLLRRLARFQPSDSYWLWRISSFHIRTVPRVGHFCLHSPIRRYNLVFILTI